MRKIQYGNRLRVFLVVGIVLVAGLTGYLHFSGGSGAAAPGSLGQLITPPAAPTPGAGTVTGTGSQAPSGGAACDPAKLGPDATHSVVQLPIDPSNLITPYLSACERLAIFVTSSGGLAALAQDIVIIQIQPSATGASGPSGDILVLVPNSERDSIQSARSHNAGGLRYAIAP